MRSCCVTDVGQKRTTNQDFVFASDTPVRTIAEPSDRCGWYGRTSGRRYGIPLCGRSDRRVILKEAENEIRSVYFEVQLKQQTKECWKRQQKTKN